MKWIKLYTVEWIDGSIRTDLDPAERSVWADLLAMAALSRREGYIERSEGVPFRIDQLASRFVVDIELLQSTIDKCVNEGRITIDGNNVLKITNWEKYQVVPLEKQKLPETEQERKMREIRQLSQLLRKYPDMAVREHTESVIDSNKQVVEQKKFRVQKVSHEKD